MGSTCQWTEPEAERPIAVVGGGVLGRRLCMMWAAAGYDVKLCEMSPKAAHAALEYIQASIDAQAARVQPRAGRAGRVELAARLEDAVSEAWMVIEAIPEILDLKTRLFADLDRLTRADCILATNSSSYKSSEMVGGVQRRYRVCNTHYYMPPIQNCVELMTCGHTEAAIFPFLMERAAAAGFVPIHAKVESTGFIFNRIWAAVKRETLLVMAEGVGTPQDIDLMFKGWFNAQFGPCEMMDSVGLDTVYNIEQHYIHERGVDSLPNDWLKENYVDKGHLGLKSGKGLICDETPDAPVDRQK